MGSDPRLAASLRPLEQAPQILSLMEELRAGLDSYWRAAGAILDLCGVRLNPPAKTAYSLQNNFFSLLFMYSYMRAGIPTPRRTLYAATLQCLRGMVTGCDNLLDDEYKKTLDTDIPAAGYRFRSVMDIMISDRVLFQLLTAAARDSQIGIDQVLAASAASMQTMTRSGVEEASEEAGVTEFLEPERVLKTIHHLKTGILFQCPWDIPLAIEPVAPQGLASLLEGLYRIGIGCQVMDDMVDLARDLRARKHNYLASLVHHGASPAEKKRLDVLGRLRDPDPGPVGAEQFPQALAQASDTARRLLTEGLSLLFAPDHQALVSPAIDFLEARIGAPRLSGEPAS